MYRRFERIGGWQFAVSIVGDKAVMSTIKDERFIHHVVFDQKKLSLYDVPWNIANLSDAEISVIQEIRHSMLPRSIPTFKEESIVYNDFE